jgi:hypothetical protein
MDLSGDITAPLLALMSSRLELFGLPLEARLRREGLRGQPGVQCRQARSGDLRLELASRQVISRARVPVRVPVRSVSSARLRSSVRSRPVRMAASGPTWPRMLSRCWSMRVWATTSIRGQDRPPGSRSASVPPVSVRSMVLTGPRQAGLEAHRLARVDVQVRAGEIDCRGLWPAWRAAAAGPIWPPGCRSGRTDQCRRRRAAGRGVQTQTVDAAAQLRTLASIDRACGKSMRSVFSLSWSAGVLGLASTSRLAGDGQPGQRQPDPVELEPAVAEFGLGLQSAQGDPLPGQGLDGEIQVRIEPGQR